MDNWQTTFTKERLAAASQRFGINPETARRIGGFENILYGYRSKGRDLVLRVSHSSHRPADQILAELNWVGYLADNGASVAKPVPSDLGSLIEVMEADRGYFTLTGFERAPGGHADARHGEWGTKLFEAWGQLTAEMHALAKTYNVTRGMPVRPDQDTLAFDTESFASPEEWGAWRKYAEVSEAISALPRGREGFGLCHRDLHHGNFFVSDGRITAFDFDDCGYDYFVQDIAMAVYYASVFPVWNGPLYDNDEISAFANRFLQHFMKGYNRAGRLGDEWLRELPLFIERRRSDLCLILFNAWSAESASDARRKWLVHNLAEIRSGVPCMALDV
ncbi:phosphotransferase enzyme family protein [Paenibacillus beijingensis]|uniref:Aminoglycoside phosphotransferase domain-containing protein n=1 Tax=Paenibacillus beijingensis TaxID=1126833 RepID=A0A0D5NKK1_9BACL|nr:phosphotransferase [Paenibacillus beijingensis]AJY75463.1 hypothetical protein VN24_13905 [Paenibacillus beijingensis]